MPRSDKEKGLKAVKQVAEDFYLEVKKDDPNWEHWRTSVWVAMNELKTLDLSAIQLNCVARLAFGLLAQSTACNGNLPYRKMVDEAVERINGLYSKKA